MVGMKRRVFGLGESAVVHLVRRKTSRMNEMKRALSFAGRTR